MSLKLSRKKRGILQLLLRQQPRDSSMMNQGLEDRGFLGVTSVGSPMMELIVLLYARSATRRDITADNISREHRECIFVSTTTK